MAPPRRKATSNPSRGEDTLSLGDASYLLRPTHGAIAGIEQDTGKPVLQLAVQCASRLLNLTELGIIVAALIRAGADKDSLDRNVNDERISELVYERGAELVQRDLAPILREAATGGRKATGERKAAPAAAPETAGAD